MPRNTPSDEPIVQLATRVPQSLRQRLRIYCAKHGLRLQDVVTAAIREKLGSQRERRRLDV